MCGHFSDLHSVLHFTFAHTWLWSGLFVSHYLVTLSDVGILWCVSSTVEYHGLPVRARSGTNWLLSGAVFFFSLISASFFPSMSKHKKNPSSNFHKTEITRTSLVAQWLRLHAHNEGTQVQSLVRELDPTCMSQLRVHMSQLRSPRATTKESTCHN